MRKTDLGSNVKCERAADNTALVAAGTGDNTAVTGVIIDRASYKYPQSMVASLSWQAVLAASKKLTMKSVVIEHGDASNLSDAANYVAPADVDVKVDGGSGGTYRGAQEYNVDLSAAKRYIRLKYTPDLNASGTDTAEVAAQFIFGGFGVLPQ